ncbi:MAG TPA: hypothetical protein PLD88_15160, partial [Candidatus Berkiella sp.]|nr:hypothetical protein [Candidatus Berkiella sp.]
KSKRGAQRLEKAYISDISKNSLNLTSSISSSRNISTIFLAVQDGSSFISSASDTGYMETEQFIISSQSYVRTILVTNNKMVKRIAKIWQNPTCLKIS